MQGSSFPNVGFLKGGWESAIQIETSQVIVMIEWLLIARGYSRYLVLRYSQKL